MFSCFSIYTPAGGKKRRNAPTLQRGRSVFPNKTIERECDDTKPQKKFASFFFLNSTRQLDFLAKEQMD